MIKMMKYRYDYIRFLATVVPEFKKFMVFGIVSGVLLMGLSFIPPRIYGYYIENVFVRGNFSSLLFVIIGYFVIYILETTLNYLKTLITNKLGNRILFHTKWKLWKVFQNQHSRPEDLAVGDMKMRIEEDSDKTVLFSSSQSSDYVISLLTTIISAILLFQIDWRIGLFSVITIPFTFFVDSLLSRKETLLLEGDRQYEGELSTWLHESVGGWQEVKSLNLQRHQELKYLHFLHRYAVFFSEWINYWVARVLIVPRIKDEFFMRFGLYFLGGFLIVNGNLKISGLLISAVYYGLLADAVKALSNSDAELKTMLPNLNRVKESASQGYNQRMNASRGMVRLDEDTLGDISFRRVSFSYDNIPILNSCSFEIKKGEHVAFVGKSGSGKTTALKLIAGLLQPSEGEIQINGVSINRIDQRRLERSIGFVTQDCILFNDTIRENLLYGKWNATEQEMKDSCAKAGILTFIESLPKGFDTIIGEKGVRLSGGQRQRISLARAFLREVDIILLDEATSALDQHGENLINEVIQNMRYNKTIISVAHRRTSIITCQRVISFD